MFYSKDNSSILTSELNAMSLKKLEKDDTETEILKQKATSSEIFYLNDETIKKIICFTSLKTYNEFFEFIEARSGGKKIALLKGDYRKDYTYELSKYKKVKTIVIQMIFRSL